MLARTLFLFGCCLCSAVGYAQTAADAARQREHVHDQVVRLHDSLQTDQAQEKDLYATLKQMDQALSTSAQQLSAQEKHIQQLQSSLDALQIQQQHTAAQLAAQRQQLEVHVREIYLNGGNGFLKMLLQQKSPQDMPRLMAYYRYLHRAQQKDLANMQATLALAQQQSATLQATLARLQQTKSHYREQIQQQKAAYAARNQVLSSLRSAIQRKGLTLTQLQADERRLDALVRSLQSPTHNTTAQPGSKAATSLARYRKSWAWPVAGTPQQGFGAPKVGDLKHSGVFFSAQTGDPVKAIDDGEVIYADWMRGYGFLLIVDHGDDYMSLYGYNQTLYKKLGDKVSKHEVIAQVGQSGSSPDPGLYFELRRHGQPIDPLAFLEKHG